MGEDRPAREFWFALGAGAVVALACYLVPSMATLVAEGEYRTVDWRFHVRGPIPPHPDVVIVAIDDASLGRVGAWPWPRELMARLIEVIESSRPRAVAVDVLYAEPGSGAGDKALAQVMRKHGNVYMPLFVSAARPPDWLFSLPALRRWQQAGIIGPRGLAGRQVLYQISGLSVPIPELASAAAGLGIVDLVGSGDGLYRDMAMIGVVEGFLVPSLPLAVVADIEGLSPRQVLVRPGECLQVGSRVLSMDVFGLTPVNFAGPSGTYPQVSAWEVLRGSKDVRQALEGRIVLVGATAAGLYDVRPTPYDADFRGVEALASAVGNVLAGDALIIPRETKAIGLAVLVALGVAAQVGLLPGIWGLAGGTALLAAYWLLTVAAFSRAGLVLPLIPVSASAAAALVAGLAARFITAERERKHAVEVFSRFVPPEIASQLVEADVQAAARGDRRVVTVLFGDIRDSSVYARHLSPEDFVEALNHFFAEAHEAIWRHGGTLDKFLGDGVLAFFNAPTHQPDHAMLAIQAALDLVHIVRSHAEVWEYYGLQGLRIGVGITTGEAIVGYVGSAERMQYTVIGATVNLAARLQELSKELDADIVVSAETYAQVADRVIAQDLGEHPVRGFDKPVRVYGITGVKRP